MTFAYVCVDLSLKVYNGIFVKKPLKNGIVLKFEVQTKISS